MYEAETQIIAYFFLARLGYFSPSAQQKSDSTRLNYFTAQLLRLRLRFTGLARTAKETWIQAFSAIDKRHEYMLTSTVAETNPLHFCLRRESYHCDRYCLSVCHSQHYYWKSNEPISLKLGVMTDPTNIIIMNRKNWITFSGDPVLLGTDSGSLFHFPHHYRIRDFRRFTYTVTSQFLRYLAKCPMPTRQWIHYIFHFRSNPADF